MCCNAFVSCSLRLPDGLTRRGDINLLMLGDPGTAKSQLLKFVERCSPIGVDNRSLVLMALPRFLIHLNQMLSCVVAPKLSLHCVPSGLHLG